MWTPKRIVVLALGFFVFFIGYMLYSSALGGIDGLPPLPEVDLPPKGPVVDHELPQSHGSKLEVKLGQAFGQDCPELKWPLKLELNSRNMVVAARDFTIEDDGRLKLDMISVALFKGEGREAEINTVRANQAYLTFDKKLGKTDKDFGGRRIVAAELNDQIKIVNNHGTEDRTKHLHMNIDKGPLYYDEAKRLIWTEDNVHLEDDKNQPPTDVRGQGLEVHLAAAEPRPEAKPAPRGKARGASFTGVERIVLKANVDMHLWITGGFLSNPPGPAAKAAPPASEAKPDKSELIIYTPGRFEYEFHKDSCDVARFDAPEGGPGHAQGIVPPVSVDHVTTSPERGQEHDQLHCQHLQLRLRNKDAAGPRGDRPAERGLEVESGHAEGQGDEGVLLTSDAQKLEARGNDFRYDARNKLTILTGDPARPDSGMSADQDGNKLHARQMQIQDLPPGPDGKAARQVTAVGPGQIDLYDKKTQKRPIHASWKEKLVSTKDGTEDLIILTGSATFIDDEHDQTLQADTLKVWLASPAGGPTANAPAGPQEARRPSHIEAIGNVYVRSSELNIPHNTGQLIVWFRDVPGDALPGAAPTAKPGAQAAAGPAPAPPAGLTPREAAKPAGQDSAAHAPAAAPAGSEPPRPISLSARSVYVWVLRSDQKSQMQQLQADGYVEVHQDPAPGADNGVDVKGEHLDMTYHPEGNFLFVSSEGNDHNDNDSNDLAQLRMEGMYIIGPEVNIDQAANKAWVNGAGGMKMESKSNFQGEPLAKPVPLMVYWKDEMFFNGRYAEFTNGVQAEQENAHLACQSLQVFFDRAISLKEGNKGGPPPRVRNLVCYKNVLVEDKTMEGDRLVRYQRMTGPSLAMNTLDPEDGAKAAGSEGNEIRGSGPGELRLLQRGGQDPLAPQPGPGGKVTSAKPAPDAKAPKPDDVMKITYISYGGAAGRGSMYVNTKTNTATFLENVRVLNMPCEDPNIEIDLDEIRNRMPEGAMYMQADRLKVFDEGDRTKSQKVMIANGHVLVQAKDFWGRSDTMTYSEAKDQIIFEGGDGGLATLYKIKQKGAEPQKIEGKKITYIRSTGMFKIEGGESISGN